MAAITQPAARATIRWAARVVAACAMTLMAALPLRAAPVDDLIDALRIDDMLSVMQQEGLAYGRDLGQDMFAGGSTARWEGLLDEIYDADKMRDIVRRDFTAALEGTDLTPLISFFNSDIGQRVVGLELDARRAMIDDNVEEAARETVRRMDNGRETPRMGQISHFIQINDLLEANVAGALNASFRFYRGLVDGGAFAMSEEEILADVWSQEEETRQDTREWLYAFLLLSYEPLEDETLGEYITLSGSPEGKALNTALFAAFNRMYDDISYALGLAAAQQMQGQDL